MDIVMSAKERPRPRSPVNICPSVAPSLLRVVATSRSTRRPGMAMSPAAIIKLSGVPPQPAVASISASAPARIADVAKRARYSMYVALKSLISEPALRTHADACRFDPFAPARRR